MDSLKVRSDSSGTKLIYNGEDILTGKDQAEWAAGICTLMNFFPRTRYVAARLCGQNAVDAIAGMYEHDTAIPNQGLLK